MRRNVLLRGPNLILAKRLQDGLYAEWLVRHLSSLKVDFVAVENIACQAICNGITAYVAGLQSLPTFTARQQLLVEHLRHRRVHDLLHALRVIQAILRLLCVTTATHIVTISEILVHRILDVHINIVCHVSDAHQISFAAITRHPGSVLILSLFLHPPCRDCCFRLVTSTATIH